MFQLEILQPDSETQIHELAEGSYSIGRDAGNDIVLVERTVSRLHARIEVSGKSLMIEDLQSSSGTSLNGEKTHGPSPLKSGDTLMLGKVKIVIYQPPTDEETLDNQVPEKTELFDSSELKELLTQRFENCQNKQFPENTFCFDSSNLHDPDVMSCHKIILLDENNKGSEEIALNPGTNDLGRASDCAIVINDSTVSRYHAVFFVDEEGCRVRDSGSQNRTRINDLTVSDEVLLSDGDVLEFGEVKYKFLEKGSVFSQKEGHQFNNNLKKKTPRTSGNKKAKIIIAVFAFFIVFLSIVLMQMFDNKKKTSVSKKSQRQDNGQQTVTTKPTANATSEKATLYFNMAEEFFNNQLWDQATAKLLEVGKISTGYPGLQAMLDKIDAELENEKTIAIAIALIEDKQYAEGLTRLRDIPTQSAYYLRAAAEINRGESLLDSNKAKEVAHVEMTLNKKKAKTKQTQGQELIKDAITNYMKGDFTAAFDLLDRAVSLDLHDYENLSGKAAHLKFKMKNVINNYENGTKEKNQNNQTKAFSLWDVALVMEIEITGSNKSYISNKINTVKANVYYDDTLAALNDSDYARSSKFCAKTLELIPQHPGALEVMNKLDSRAKILYEKGYVIEDLDPAKAIELWKSIIETCPPGTPYYIKAKKALSKYN